MLIWYSLAIGLKTCWTRKRSWWAMAGRRSVDIPGACQGLGVVGGLEAAEPGRPGRNVGVRAAPAVEVRVTEVVHTERPRAVAADARLVQRGERVPVPGGRQRGAV